VIIGLWVLVGLFSGAPAQLVRESLSSAAILSAQIGQASDTVLESRVRAVASELRCPVCQGESIQDSPAALAQEMKAIVREQLAAGRTPDEVKAYFVEKYGEWILLRPKARGWNVLVYVLPLLALVVGGLVIARAMRRWSGATNRQTVEEAQQETAET